ncbi:MAG: hypothetical protein RMK29_01225 [Myxococcales bacterium]|nr:hypothetical protein [Myxococcota bacterium]MDW8280299.1 hypothetical protein [Myxococcales bacterium]
MVHIEIVRHGEPPCGGPVRPEPPPEPPRRALPVLGAPPPPVVWVCDRCGRRWNREPRPDEAL